MNKRNDIIYEGGEASAPPIAKALPVPPPMNDIYTHCPRYRGYGGTILSVSAFLIVFVLFLGFAGPWYNDCDHNDCSVQKTNGLYCDDYCISGSSGPGSLLVAFCLGGILISVSFPYCCVNPDLRRRREVYEQDPQMVSFYEI